MPKLIKIPIRMVREIHKLEFISGKHNPIFLCVSCIKYLAVKYGIAKKPTKTYIIKKNKDDKCSGLYTPPRKIL